MLIRNKSPNREDYFIKYVLTAEEKIPYLLQDAENVMEKI
jgi:hypothetical protein